jgi:1-phosphatidylinositol-3-phosphate 5-kinase
MLVLPCREQAVALGQALVDAKWLDCISRVDQVFSGDYALYHPGEAALKEQVLKVVSVTDVQTDDEGPAVPDWFRQIEQDEDDTGTEIPTYNEL